MGVDVVRSSKNQLVELKSDTRRPSSPRRTIDVWECIRVVASQVAERVLLAAVAAAAAGRSEAHSVHRPA